MLLKKISENLGKGKSLGEIMRELGYSKTYSLNPDQLKATSSWQALMDKYLSDEDLAETHKGLLKATSIDHMVFITDEKTLPDDEIREMLASVNCTVRKIIHGETARHVYFWSPDNRARKDGVEMAYKLKKRYGDTTIVHKFGEFSDAELEEEIAGEISEALGTVEGEEAPAGKPKS